MLIRDWLSDVCSSDLLGCYTTGVAIVTTLGRDGYPDGLTVNSFTSVSLDRSLVLFCLDRESGSGPAFAAADRSELSRVGKECSSKCRSRREQVHHNETRKNHSDVTVSGNPKRH